MAVEQMDRYGIPASITMAQALLESRAGMSPLATKGHNHFGIKCGTSWSGPYMLMNDDAQNEHFRVYDNDKSSYDDHSLFLLNSRRYASLFQLRKTDYKGWAYGLKAAGYATNPNYAVNLIQIIEDYNLTELDNLTMGSMRRQTKHQKEIEKQSDTHEVWMCNRNFYTIARSGDTFKSLSREMGVSQRKLRKYNELPHHSELHPGDIIFFEKKQKNADKDYSQVYHRMKADESLYDLSQRYGMRLQTLYDINHLSEDYAPSEGDLILIRK